MPQRQPGIAPGAPTNPGLCEIGGEVASDGHLPGGDIGAPSRGERDLRR